MPWDCLKSGRSISQSRCEGMESSAVRINELQGRLGCEVSSVVFGAVRMPCGEENLRKTEVNGAGAQERGLAVQLLCIQSAAARRAPNSQCKSVSGSYTLPYEAHGRYLQEDEQDVPWRKSCELKD